MNSIRPVLASLLLAALAVGGVTLPAVHTVVHGLEIAAEQADHQATAHAGDGEQVQAPCAPAPHDVDCAICTGISAGADLASVVLPTPDTPASAVSAYADWTRTAAAAGAGARAPPAS